MLPEDGHEDEDGGDEDECECDLRYGSRREGLDVDLGAGALIAFLVPAREGCEEDKAEECEDDGDNEQVREDDGVLEGGCDPDQIQGILVHGHTLHQGGSVVGADVVTTVLVDADTKVADAHSELRIADNVCDGLGDAGVDLLSRVGGRILFIPHRNEEDARNEGRCRGASC